MKDQNNAVSGRDAQVLTEDMGQATNLVDVANVASMGGAAAWQKTMGANGEAAGRQIGGTTQRGEGSSRLGARVLTGQALGNLAVNGATETLGQQELMASQAEIARDEAELTHAEEFVGDETATQMRERLADDREDLVTELGDGSPRDFRIMTKNTERLTNEAVTAVDHLIKEQAVHPAKLEQVRFKMMTALLKDAYSRNFGDRN